METMYGPQIGKDTVRKVCDQVVLTVLNRIKTELNFVVEEKKRLNTSKVIRSINDLDSYELDDDAKFIVTNVLVHTAVHFILSSRDVKAAWPTANKMLLKGECVDESVRIADLRAKGMLLIKSCVSRALKTGREAMTAHAAEFDFEYPISGVVAEITRYIQKLVKGLGELWVSPSPHRSSFDEIESEIGEDDSQERKRDVKISSKRKVRSSKRLRSAGKLSAAGSSRKAVKRTRDTSFTESPKQPPKTPQQKEKSSTRKTRKRARQDIEWETPDNHSESESVEQAEDQDNEKGNVKERGDEGNGLSNSHKKALQNLDGATSELRSARGDDPLEEAVERSRVARRGKSIYRLSPNARDATPICEDDISEDERPRTRLSRTMPSRLKLEKSSDSPKTPERPTADVEVDANVQRKGPFTVQEDSLLINGLKKYGWSEWNRIASNCWNNMPFKRSAAQIKDRSRYLDKTARIDRLDYPASYSYRRAGPPSKVDSEVQRGTPTKEKANVEDQDSIEDVDEDDSE